MRRAPCASCQHLGAGNPGIDVAQRDVEGVSIVLGLHIQRVRRHNDAKDGADLRCAQVIERARVAVSDKDGRARGHRLPTAHTATRYGNLPHHCRLHDPPEWLSPLCSCRRLGIAVCHVCGACSAGKFTFTRLNFKFNISFPGSHKFRMRRGLRGLRAQAYPRQRLAHDPERHYPRGLQATKTVVHT